MRSLFFTACLSFSAFGALPLSQQAARTGSFVLRDGASVGIEFAHQWTPPERYRKTFDHSGAGGVAIGDFDADGKPDVFLTRPFGGAKLYRNLGGWKFQDVTAQSGVEREQRWAGGATWADVDGDGDLDLTVCGYDCANRLWRNNGDGSFTDIAAASGLAVKGGSTMMTFADFDHDGRIDLYVNGTVTGGVSYRDYLYRNTGSAFEDVTPANLAALEADHGAQWADVDGDGAVDLALTGAAGAGLHGVWRNGLAATDAARSLAVRVLDAEGRSTRAGAEVRVYAAGTRTLLGTRVMDAGSGYNSQSDAAVQFGFAVAGQVDVEVAWAGAGLTVKVLRRNVDPAAYRGRVLEVRVSR